jgi:hypothetical protein
MKTGFRNINLRQRKPALRTKAVPASRNIPACGCDCRRRNAELSGAVAPKMARK